MHTWQWQTWNQLPYLTCDLLQSWPHGFFTQQFWPRPPAELSPILHPAAQTYRVQQVHGNRVLTPGEIETATANSESLAAADGVMSEQVQQAVWVCSADCTPVLIGDRRTGQVAAVHAGWRGTAGKIVPQAIARLQTQGSQLADLLIAMGPAIAGEVYQVSIHTAAEVGATILPAGAATPEVLVEQLHQLPNSPLHPDPEPGRVKLDVRRVNAIQLEQMGIAPEQVAIAPHCTYRDRDYFFSYRRDRLKQAQWSGIVSCAGQPN